MNGTVILADDHEVFRLGLESVVTKLGLQVVGHAATGEELVAAVERIRPDLIITDYLMPGLSGIEAVHLLRQKVNTKVLLLTNVESEEIAERCFRGDIQGYVFKSIPREELVRAIMQVMKGRTYYASLREAAPPAAKLQQSPLAVLSPRETEIVAMIAIGKSQHEIAEALGISPKTLEHHRSHINEKLGRKSIAELVRMAYVWGLVKDAGLASTYI